MKKDTNHNAQDEFYSARAVLALRAHESFQGVKACLLFQLFLYGLTFQSAGVRGSPKGKRTLSKAEPMLFTSKMVSAGPGMQAPGGRCKPRIGLFMRHGPPNGGWDTGWKGV